MWVFGQVWFACLVGFVVGVGLTWLWQVRPLSRRVADLQRAADLAETAQQRSRQDADRAPGFGNTGYDAGFGAEPRTELATAATATRTHDSDFDQLFAPEEQAPPPAHVETRQINSVDDYVEALVQEYRGDTPPEAQTWTEQNPEAVESWRPGALGARLDSGEYAGHTPYEPEPTAEPEPEPAADRFEAPTTYQPNPLLAGEAAEATQINAFPAQTFQPEPYEEPAQQTRFVNTEFGGRGDADEQYLEYLRSGSDPEDGTENAASTNNHQPLDEAEDEQAEDQPYGYEQRSEPEQPEHTRHEYAQADFDGYGQEYADEHAEAEPEHAAEVTTVLPFIDAEPVHELELAGGVDDVDQADEADEPAEEPEEIAQPAAHAIVEPPAHAAPEEDEAGLAEEQDFFTPAAINTPVDSTSITTVVRPPVSGGGPIASAQPFQLDGPDRSDANARKGMLTPIEEGGFQPFAKPGDEVLEDSEYDDYDGDYDGGSNGYHRDAAAQPWQDDWSAEPVESAHAQAEPEEQRDPAEQTGPVAADVIAAADAALHHHEPELAADVPEVPEEEPAESTTVFSAITDEPPTFSAEPEPAHQGAQDDYDDYDSEPASVSRSLFEPVIEPELPTSYVTPVAPPAPQAQQPEVSEAEQSMPPLPKRVPSPPPHPIRVRTGVQPGGNGARRAPSGPSAPQVPLPKRPVRAPAGSAGWQSGPFGPGSALPLPDGSAPSPQFRVKARTSSMVFHTESSPFYDRLEPQVWFASQEDAQRAGFTSWERPRTW